MKFYPYVSMGIKQNGVSNLDASLHLLRIRFERIL